MGHNQSSRRGVMQDWQYLVPLQIKILRNRVAKDECKGDIRGEDSIVVGLEGVTCSSFPL